MDENTWRIVQLGMWAFGLQTGVIVGVIGFMWKSMSNRFEKIDARFEKVDKKFEYLDVKLTDIDKRIFAIETMLHMKDCCMLKDDRQLKKAE